MGITLGPVRTAGSSFSGSGWPTGSGRAPVWAISATTPGRVRVWTRTGRILPDHPARHQSTVPLQTVTPQRTSCLAPPLAAVKERKVFKIYFSLKSLRQLCFSFPFFFLHGYVYCLGGIWIKNECEKNKDEDSRLIFFFLHILFCYNFLFLDFASSFCGSFMIDFYNWLIDFYFVHHK